MKVQMKKMLCFVIMLSCVVVAGARENVIFGDEKIENLKTFVAKAELDVKIGKMEVKSLRALAAGTDGENLRKYEEVQKKQEKILICFSHILQGMKSVEGYGVPKDMKKAANSFRQAMKVDPESLVFLTEMFKAGLVVPLTDEEALLCFRNNPKQSKADVFYELGMLYDIGLIPNQKTEATRWLRKAADLDHKDAKSHLELLSQLEESNRQLRRSLK